jgi:ABC-type cobalamin/Fe3+-siderophores transport system ATPase subunit
MRKAAIDKAWDDCRASPKKRLDVSQISIGLGETVERIRVTSRVSALLGENGSGKTTLLKSMSELGNHSPSGRVHVAAVTASTNGTAQTLLNYPGLTAPMPIVRIDPSDEVHGIQEYLSGQQNLEEYVQQFETRNIVGEDLSVYQAVLTRQYTSLKVRELESPADPDEVIPYFEIHLPNGAVYDSRAMGFGEHCACFLLWRLAQCEKGSIVLIDEPDSHLSAFARRALTDYLAVLAASNELWILFSSHSIEPIEKLREEDLILLRRPEFGHPAPAVLAQHKRDAIINLGLSLSKRFLIVVEDIDAQEVVSQALARWEPKLARACEVRGVARGAEELATLARLFPSDTSVCKLLVVLDGDKREAVGIRPNVHYLPGAVDPFASILAWAPTAPTTISQRLGVDETVLGPCLAQAATGDYHDFCSLLSGLLQQPLIDTRQVRRVLVAAWLDGEPQQTEFQAFVTEMRKAFEAVLFFN